MVTQERLKELLTYNKRNGTFVWAKPTATWLRPGDSAGGLDKNGAIRIKIDGRLYLAHRLAWLYLFGEWPSGCLDHINRNRQDNRIKNLRLATYSQNGQNKNHQKNNKSGTPGVYFSKDTNSWRVQINVNKKRINLGRFKSKDLAIAARLSAEKEHFQFKIYADKRIAEERENG